MEKALQSWNEQFTQWLRSPSPDPEQLRAWLDGYAPAFLPEWRPADYISWALEQQRDLNGAAAHVGSALQSFFKSYPDTKAALLSPADSLIEALRLAHDRPSSGELTSALLRLLDDRTLCEGRESVRIAGPLRAALIVNQDNNDLEHFWLELLAGKPQGCLSPAPLTDINGVFRLAQQDPKGSRIPNWDAIGTGIGHIARLHEKDRLMRPLMRTLWADFFAAWDKDLGDDAWNWKLIQCGLKAGWPDWVFETVPLLFGRIPEKDTWFCSWLYSKAGCFQGWIVIESEICPAIHEVSLADLSVRAKNLLVSMLNVMESRRRAHASDSSKGLLGIVIDTANEKYECVPEFAAILQKALRDSTSENESESESLPSLSDRHERSPSISELMLADQTAA